MSKKRKRTRELSGMDATVKAQSLAKTLTILATTIACLLVAPGTHAISIKNADFDRLIMPCYLPQASLGQLGQQQYGGDMSGRQSINMGGSSGGGYFGGGGGGAGGSYLGGNGPVPGPGVPLPPTNGRLGGGGGPNGGSDGLLFGSNSNQFATSGQSSYQQVPRVNSANQFSNGNGYQSNVPRANTMDNFIALLMKIETANPRLANSPDQLIRSLLSRFHLDNYYYDVRSRARIKDDDHRVTDITPALLNPQLMSAQQQLQQPQFMMSSEGSFPENSLDQAEKCSMYFMLSHFIEKTSSLSAMSPTSQLPLSAQPVVQLAGPLNGQRPPVLQAAGAGYPGQSANAAFSGAGPSAGPGAARYPGPSPSFGSPATSNMNSYGAGISNQPDYVGKSAYGMNVPQPSNPYNQPRPLGGAAASISGSSGAASLYSSNPRPVAPYIDAGGSSGRGRNPSTGMATTGDDRVAIEHGVVALPNQENAALVLNRVLMGILAAGTQPQTIRQLSSAIYPTQSPVPTPKFDEEIDPLYAVTLADLWAVSSIPRAGKPPSPLGDNGHWNDSMCPTSFTLERANSIRFTTAELLGGLDGFNLGMFRRRLASMRRSIRLSEMLRIYYSRTGFRPQFAEVGVCNRAATLNTQLDDLHRQAENYMRLYDINTPTPDNELSMQISRLGGFRDLILQAANQYAPQDLCLDSTGGGGGFDLYPMSPQDQCEVSRAELVMVMDTSPQANQQFMQLVAVKLAQRLGLSRDGSSVTLMTNQQDSTGYAGAYSFNTILRNSTNTAEIGCALAYDTTQSYQGSQVTEPTRIVEMFERALVSLDSEYLIRQSMGMNSYNNNYREQQSTYVSSWFNGGGASDSYLQGGGGGGGPRNTGGSKVIVYFNYGQQVRPAMLGNAPTNWNPQASQSQQNEYKFYEAKKYLRENFRGASVLAVANGREDVKSLVYDEERDIFTDIPQGNGGNGRDLLSSSSADFYPSSVQDPTSSAQLSGPADQLVNKLLQRMCTIPAMFQYPMCFRQPSDRTASVGYISPGRKQYWMMSPKSFFSSRSVRLMFKVEGGRLRVCFGRQPSPDETALRYSQQNYQTGGISFQQGISSGGAYAIGGSNSNGNVGQSGGSMQQVVTTQAPVISSSDYYTGLEHGVCKDVAPNQEIDFLVSEPCYKKSIAECEPFYFVIKETSNPGEGDPNYMCRDPGCKRFDQAKFVMSHTGVTCSSALKGARANWLLIMISAALAVCLNGMTDGPSNPPLSTQQQLKQQLKQLNPLKGTHKTSRPQFLTGVAAIVTIALYTTIVQQVQAQQAGVYDFGQNRYGEKRGNFTPSEVLSIILVVMVILGGLAITVGLCYYVTKRARRGMEPVEQDGY